MQDLFKDMAHLAHNPINKWTKEMNRHFTAGAKQMTKKP